MRVVTRHAGHVTYLEQARKLGDRLVVAVNDDASVKKLKGEERPVNTLERRMRVLAGLECVDWVVSFGDMRVAFLPLVGVCALITGGLLGIGLAKLMKRTPKQTGVLFCCGSFTNIGAIGGPVCYVFLGEAGFALIALYKMFEEIVYYTIGFPLARFYSGDESQQQSLGKRILGVVTDPFVCAALSAFLIGLLLNILSVTRPEIFGAITAISVPAGTFILIVSIGLGMRFSRVGKYIKESLGIFCILSHAIFYAAYFKTKYDNQKSTVLKNRITRFL